MRTMYDGINRAHLPAGGDLYAGYVDGRWPWAVRTDTRVYGRPVVRIASSPSTNDGVVGDGPPDNGTWAEWVQWTVRRRAAGVDPTMYTDADQWPTGIAAFEAAGVVAPHWWIAKYLSSAPSLSALPAIPAGAVALQCFDFGTYDLSVVADYWPGVDPVPHPAAAAAPLLEENSMQIEPTSVHPGEYAAIVPSGVGQLVLAANGAGAGPAKLRVTLWNNDKVQPTQTFEVGGSSAHHVLGHALAGATAVTAQRLDAEAYPLALGFRA